MSRGMVVSKFSRSGTVYRSKRRLPSSYRKAVVLAYVAFRT